MASLPAPPNSGYAEDIGEIEMKRKNTKWIIGGAIIAAVIIGLSFLQLGDNLVYFYTPAEATAQAKDLETKTIKIGAKIVTDSLTPRRLRMIRSPKTTNSAVSL